MNLVGVAAQHPQQVRHPDGVRIERDHVGLPRVLRLTEPRSAASKMRIADAPFAVVAKSAASQV